FGQAIGDSIVEALTPKPPVQPAPVVEDDLEEVEVKVQKIHEEMHATPATTETISNAADSAKKVEDASYLLSAELDTGSSVSFDAPPVVDDLSEVVVTAKARLAAAQP